MAGLEVRNAKCSTKNEHRLEAYAQIALAKISIIVDRMVQVSACQEHRVNSTKVNVDNFRL